MGGEVGVCSGGEKEGEEMMVVCGKRKRAARLDGKTEVKRSIRVGGCC